MQSLGFLCLPNAICGLQPSALFLMKAQPGHFFPPLLITSVADKKKSKLPSSPFFPLAKPKELVSPDKISITRICTGFSPCRWTQCRGGCRGRPPARPASGTVPAPTARPRWSPARGRCSGSAGTRSTGWTTSSHTPPRTPCGCCSGGRWPMAVGPGREGGRMVGEMEAREALPQGWFVPMLHHVTLC